MKKIGLLIMLTFGLISFSCKTASTVTDFSKIKQTLETTQWALQDENGNVKGLDNQNMVLSFRNEDGLTAHGFAGCNSYQTKVFLTPTNINFSDIGSTKVYCPQINQENAYFDLLKQTNRYELSGKTLSLFKDNLLLAKFKSL